MGDQKEFSYLAIVPRGLQNDISSVLQRQAKGTIDNFDSDEDNDANREDIDDERAILEINIWNREEDDETMREALRDFSTQREEKRKRRKSHQIERSVKHQPGKIQLEENIATEWLPDKCIIGSVKLSSSGQHVSIGYIPIDEKRNGDTRKGCDHSLASDQKSVQSHMPSWTCSGQLAGSVWMQIDTNRKEISRKVLAPSRMLGPLVALISIQADNKCLEASTSVIAKDDENSWRHDRYECFYKHSLEEMTAEVTRHIRSNSEGFSGKLDRALGVWRDCVEETWKDRLSPEVYTGLQSRIKDNRLRFRISCVRVEPGIVPSRSKRKKKSLHSSPDSNGTKSVREIFAYSRRELCQAIMETCGPALVPGFYDQPLDIAPEEIFDKGGDGDGITISSNSKGSGPGSGGWSVDLENFDVEIVLFIIPPDLRSKHGKLAFGISLCPYSFLQSKSFACGHIPPDVTLPYLGGDIISQGIVRLRPTTAHVLLQMANIEKYDIILDPCAGVGTIPIEAEQYCKHLDSLCRQGLTESKQFLSIGGDLCLNNSKYTKVAGVMENYSRGKNAIDSATVALKSSSLLVAWDAAHIPIRKNSVDVVVSDLPFGQQCLSATALAQLLPLVFLECARILKPSTGRIVTLAGGSPVALIANIEKLSGKYWKKPISRMSPVSIGGLLAWVVRVDRNEEIFDATSVPNRLALARQIAQKRDEKNLQRKSDSGEQQTGKRRRAKGMVVRNYHS